MASESDEDVRRYDERIGPTRPLILRQRPPRDPGPPGRSWSFAITDPAPESSRERLNDIIGLTPEAAVDVARDAGYAQLLCYEEGGQWILTSDVVTGQVRAFTRDGAIVRIQSAFAPYRGPSLWTSDKFRLVTTVQRRDGLGAYSSVGSSTQRFDTESEALELAREVLAKMDAQKQDEPPRTLITDVILIRPPDEHVLLDELRELLGARRG